MFLMKLLADSLHHYSGTYKMNQENVTVTLTATEHELVNEALLQLQNCFDVVYSYTEAYENVEMRDKMNEVNNLRTKFVELWADRFDDEAVPEPSPEPPQASQVLYDEPAQQHGFKV